jgi:MYXO-CTERM domain-containing protein
MCVPPGGYGYDTGSSGGVATASDEPREQSAGKGEDGQVVNDDGEGAAPHDDVAENADEGDAKKNSVSSSGHGSGCSVNVPGGRTPSGLWLSALFGLLLLRRKRTTQWRI